MKTEIVWIAWKFPNDQIHVLAINNIRKHYKIILTQITFFLRMVSLNLW